VAGGSNGSSAAAEPTLADVMAAVNGLSRRIDQVEAGGIRYVPSEPEPTPDARAVNPEAMDPFTRKLWEDRTHDTPQDYGGDQEPSYNIPPRLYLKNDGSYAWLQGDFRSRGYYQSKGFYCLNADEVAEYQKLEPGIVAAQRGKATAYNAIVQLINTDPALVGYKNDNDFIGELDLLTEDQLRQETWPRLNQEAGHPDRPLPPPKRFRSEGRDRGMDGVETTPPRARMREFEAEQSEAKPGRRGERSEPSLRSGGRVVEVTPANARQFPV